MCAGLLKRYFLFLTAYSSCNSKSIELYSAGVAISGKMSSSVHSCWHLSDEIMEWTGFQLYINLRRESMLRWDKATDWDYWVVCMYLYLIIVLIVRLLCEQVWWDRMLRWGGGVCVRRCHLPSFHILTFWGDALSLAWPPCVWACIVLTLRAN